MTADDARARALAENRRRSEAMAESMRSAHNLSPNAKGDRPKAAPDVEQENGEMQV